MREETKRVGAVPGARHVLDGEEGGRNTASGDTAPTVAMG